MPTLLHEPNTIALILVIASTLLALATILSRATDRFGIPLMLGFLVVGMLAGEDGPGRIQFSNHHAAYRIGTAALALILFDGGLNTPLGMVRSNWRPATVLATLGVLLVAGAGALFGRLLGFPWRESALIGAVVSCTDAAAVFAVLRGQNLRLKRRVGVTLELEAGLNDPMAVVLTMTFTALLISEGPSVGQSLAQIPVQLGIGAAIGWAVGQLGARMLDRVQLPTSGLYPVLTVAIAGFGFGLPTLLWGSGFLGVYIAGAVVGNRAMPYRATLLRVHAALSWIAQITMFLILGLLVTPSRLGPVAWPGIALALLMTFLGRPLAVLACLAPFGFSLREMVYIGWVGLRGAVPIVLATIPVLAGVPLADHLFHVVFVIVVVGTLLPGASVRWVSRRLGMQAKSIPRPRTRLDLHSDRPVDGEVLSFLVDGATPAAGRPLGDLGLPAGAWVVGLVRDECLRAPDAGERVQIGDQLLVGTPRSLVGEVNQHFGIQDQEG